MQAALAVRDIGAVYRALTGLGVSQRQIATLTEQSQSEVSEIIKGRVVRDYRVLERIAIGLGIPRHYMGLSYGADNCQDAYRGGVPVFDPEEVAEMLRRQFQHLLALGAAAAVGASVPKVGVLDTALPVPGLPVDLPNRISVGDVAVIQGYTENLRAVARAHGGQGRAAVALTEWADRWLRADASDAARRALLAALSDLHTIAGWCCHDSRAELRAHYHFARAAELGTDAGDGYRTGYALYHAGLMLIHRSQPNRALKLTQLGEHHLITSQHDDPEVAGLVSWLCAVSAFALACLDYAEQARSHLDRARGGWRPASPHARADMDLLTAQVWQRLDKIDSAEAAATSAARTFAQGSDRRDGVEAQLVHARLHVQTGEPTGLRLAHDAITTVSQVHSSLPRELWLEPLADALDTRSSSDAKDLARMARQVATTRV